MIAIIGTNHDDILYFEATIANKTTETVLNIYPLVRGTIFNQEVILISGVNTSILSSAVMTYLFDKFFIDLAILLDIPATDSNSFILAFKTLLALPK